MHETTKLPSFPAAPETGRPTKSYSHGTSIRRRSVAGMPRTVGNSRICLQLSRMFLVATQTKAMVLHIASQRLAQQGRDDLCNSAIPNRVSAGISSKAGVAEMPITEH